MKVVYFKLEEFRKAFAQYSDPKEIYNYQRTYLLECLTKAFNEYHELKHIKKLLGIESKMREGNPDFKFEIIKALERNTEALIEQYEYEEPEPMNQNNNSNLRWVGDKNELCELLWALWKSQRVKDANTGKTIEREKLIKEFENLFNIDLKNFDDLLNRKLKTYQSQDNKTFVNELKNLIDERISKK